MSVEYEDLPDMSDWCKGGDYCEECQEFNYPAPCPCGFKDYPTWWADEVPL